MRGVANLSLAILSDIVHSQMGVKESNSCLSAIRETRRSVQVGQQIGENKEVLG